MKLSRTLPAILFVLYELPVFAQTCFSIGLLPTTERAKEMIQDNEFLNNGSAMGNFFCNPLQINGQPLDYNQFSLQSKGDLTLIKESFIGHTIQIPFYVYLRRNGTMIKLPGEEESKTKYLKLEISAILKLAEPGDQLILDPVNKEDWRAKRILKLLKDGC